MKVFPLLILIAVSSLNTAFSTDAHADERTGSKHAAAVATLRSIIKDCYHSKLNVSPLEGLHVNGHVLNAPEARNVQWIGECVAPFLPGTPDERAAVAARTTWWALREGVLEMTGERLFGYSNCHENGKDRHRTTQPGYNCGTNIWQVGMAAGQVANYSKELYAEKTEEVLSNLHPALTDTALLAWTASLAGYEENSSSHKSIISSTGRVKRSWLLRNPLVGFLLVEKQEVKGECLTDKKKWCFSGSFPAAKKFSGSVKGMNKSIADLKRYFLMGS